MRKRFIIIGGVAAGMSAASKIRSLDPEAEITVFEKSSYVSYIACGMPYYIGKIVDSPERLVAYDAMFFKQKRNIDVFLHHEVSKIIPNRKTVMIKNPDHTEDKEYTYDKLLIATGARPFVPPIKGLSLDGVNTLRNLEDGIGIRHFIDTRLPKNGVIMGAGYIGMEMAEAFVSRGIQTTIVEKMPDILGTMDNEINEIVEQEIKTNGVSLIKTKAISEFEGIKGVINKAILENGDSLEADIALIGAGIRPNSEIAGQAGIDIGKSGAIKINNRMETNIPDIYAAGDCAEAFHLVYGRNAYIPLGTTANKQGRIAGENMTGGNAIFNGIVGTSVFKVFSLEVGRTGLTEKDANHENISCVTNTIEHFSRAHYFPGVSRIKVKLTADKSGRLLGAQLVGHEGVAQRVNILATAITAGFNVGQIASLDLGYAPPFAPVYDPVLIAASEIEKKL